MIEMVFASVGQYIKKLFPIGVEPHIPVTEAMNAVYGRLDDFIDATGTSKSRKAGYTATASQ